MHNILAIMYREYKIRVTSMTWIFFDLGLPMFYLLVFGIGLNKAFTGGVIVDGINIDYNSFFLAGVLSMSGFGIAINTSYGFFMDRDNGIFYEFLTYPMTRGEFLLGKIFFSGCLTTIQATLTVLLGVVVLKIRIHFDLVLILLLINMLFTAGWFFFLSIFALRIKRNDFYNTVINVCYFVLMFASSVFFPLDNSPAWLRVAALLNPLTWHTDTLRFLSIGVGEIHRIWIESAAFILFALISFAGGVNALKKSA